MGISVAASAQNSGNQVYWCSTGRSSQSKERAAEYNLIDASNLESLCRYCSIIISVCPPHAAEEVANQVLEQSFSGIYVDANAISPERAKRIGELVTESGAIFVDGGIIGGPAWKPSTTWLHLSGPQAAQIAACFSTGPLETNVLNEQIGSASALKMCFASYTKGTTALLCGILATAEKLGVRQQLEHQWTQYGWDLAEEAHQRATRVTAKAWRFAGEMEEIASTFQSAGMPAGFHQAAGEIYRRLANYKDRDGIPSLEAVLDDLLQRNPQK